MAIQIIGRSSSHFTRVTQIFALELGVEYQLVPLFEIPQSTRVAFAGNPALKIPTSSGELALWGPRRVHV
jgi:hypothetical protein